jgi:hypothetical protein
LLPQSVDGGPQGGLRRRPPCCLYRRMRELALGRHVASGSIHGRGSGAGHSGPATKEGQATRITTGS